MGNAYRLHFLATVIAGWINRYQQAIIESDDGQMSADTVYDSGTYCEAILSRGAVPTIPPRRKAKLSHAKHLPPFRADRDAVAHRIKGEGRYQCEPQAERRGRVWLQRPLWTLSY